MFIIAGTIGKSYKAGFGTFYCSNCGVEREYTRYEVHRAATLFFVPVAKMGLLGEYVVCNHCDTGYEMSALDYDPEVEREEIIAIYEKALRRAMVMMMLIDGDIKEEEISAIQNVYKEIFEDDEFTEKEIEEELAKCEAEPRTLIEYIEEITPYLTDNSRELMVESIYRISISDGDADENEMILLKHLAKLMGVSSSHLKGIIAEVDC